jgi:hypothetical protein
LRTNISAFFVLRANPRTHLQIRKCHHQQFSSKVLDRREPSQIFGLCLLPAALSFLPWKASCVMAHLDFDHLALHNLHVLCCLLLHRRLGPVGIRCARGICRLSKLDARDDCTFQRTIFTRLSQELFPQGKSSQSVINRTVCRSESVNLCTRQGQCEKETVSRSQTTINTVHRSPSIKLAENIRNLHFW